MTDHPITPPPELVEQWRTAPEYTNCREKLTMVSMTTRRLQEITDQAARWGADQELKACCEWLKVCCEWLKAKEWIHLEFSDELRAVRRPKPSSLKEQALEVLMKADGADHPVPVLVLPLDEAAVIRRALEELPD